MALILPVATARAEVYRVGPGRQYQSLQQVTGRLRGGDVVMLDGGVTYVGGVTLGVNKGGGVITIMGLRVGGKRPVLVGGAAVLRVLGDHYVIDGLDLTGGNDLFTKRCFYNVGDDVTLRDCVVHDCRCTGIAGADASGSLTLDGVEVYHCGLGEYAHQIYVGSSLAKYPKALFRMQYCYIHDGAGGNNVKSRTTRNEIEYNWIEGAAFHELDLVGPDPKSQAIPAGGVHCDADVIGNVFVKRPGSQGTFARVGSDGTGASRGRYRFVNNTVIVQAQPAAGLGLFWMNGQVDSVDVVNNVFWSEVGPMRMVRQARGAAPALAGEGNWAPAYTKFLPAEWKIILGADPGFLNPAAGDYRPAPGSALIGAGSMPPEGAEVTGMPPAGAPATDRDLVKSEAVRPPGREKDIGAYPFAAPQ